MKRREQMAYTLWTDGPVDPGGSPPTRESTRNGGAVVLTWGPARVYTCESTAASLRVCGDPCIEDLHRQLRERTNARVLELQPIAQIVWSLRAVQEESNGSLTVLAGMSDLDKLAGLVTMLRRMRAACGGDLALVPVWRWFSRVAVRVARVEVELRRDHWSGLYAPIAHEHTIESVHQAAQVWPWPDERGSAQ